MAVASVDRMAIVRGSDTNVPRSFLDKVQRAAASVGRLKGPQGRHHLASAFLIEGNRIVTADYVLPDEETAESWEIEFDFYVLADGLFADPLRMALSPGNFFVTGLGLTVVGLDGDDDDPVLRDRPAIAIPASVPTSIVL